MKKIVILFFIFSITGFSQQKQSKQIDFYSPHNIKKFADYLFCQHDYLRAVFEYQKYLNSVPSDTVKFKVGIAYSRMGYYSKAENQFLTLRNSNSFKALARAEYYKSLFQQNNFEELQSNLKYKIQTNEASNSLNKLYYLSYLFMHQKLPGESDFAKPFYGKEKIQVKNFYEWKKNPPYKSPVVSAILSAIIPGLGKVYVKEYSDGIMAFLATSVLGYIAYADFNAGHKFRGWLFTGLTAGFYAGNIYGSAAAAQIYNAKIKFDFTKSVKSFLEYNNWFTPILDFCK